MRYDSCHDPVFVTVLFRAMITETKSAPIVVHEVDGSTSGTEVPTIVAMRGNSTQHCSRTGCNQHVDRRAVQHADYTRY